MPAPAQRERTYTQAHSTAHGHRRDAALGDGEMTALTLPDAHTSPPQNGHARARAAAAAPALMRAHSAETGMLATSSFQAKQPKKATYFAAPSVGLQTHDTAIPDYPRAWVYPLLPWGAPVTLFPEWLLRGQTFMIWWEAFTLVWVVWTSFDVPYTAGYVIEDLNKCQGWHQVRTACRL